MNDRPLTIVTPSALSPHEGDDVHGMHGRVRLAKDKISPDGLVSPTNATARKKPGETWMDEERRNVQAYEYLCHIGEVKEWVEACIREEIDQISELEESMRNGIAIAKLARFFAPTEVRRIFEGSKLQFRHIDNINFLFGAMKHVGLPEIFFFETTDLYDKKNIPKVIYCLHALAHLLFKKKMAPSIKNLIGKLEFTEDEINATQKGLDDAGISLPVFGDISSTLEKELNDAAIAGGPTEAPEPELTEEQKRDLYWSDKDDQLRRCQNIARACSRAHKERNAMLERKALHRAFANPESGTLVKFQAVARGVLVRKRTRAKLAEIKKATPHIIQLQAICRGHFARKHYRERIGHLKSHKDEIVKIQSKFRSHSAKKAFESLMRGENPPVGTIRNYVHLLLSNSDREFDEELELERLRQEAVTMIRENTAIESSLNELDNKIALLVKNRITVEEVVKTAKRGKITDSRDRLALSTDELDSGANNNMASMVGLLKSRDKESRKRLEAYQQLFYMLQTEPSYLAKLLFFMNKATAGEKQKKFVENIVLTIFGYAQNAREEYLLLKLFQLSITEEMSIVTEISEFLRGNPVFIKLAVQYNRGAKEMRYLRDLLQPRVKDVMGNRDLDLQTDPLIIYKSSIANEELQTGKKSKRPYEVTREQALADEDTRTVYIKHLQQLRTCADGFLEAIIGGVSTMPYGIRCIARQLRVAFVTKFGPTNEDQIMKVIGHFLYYRYMNPAIVAPEAFDVIETQVDPAQRKNLAEISKVLNQISNGKGFADDNIYLQPLNDYVISASQKFGSYLKQVTEVPEPETQFQVDEFQDVTQKPVIYVSPQEIFMTHTVISRSIDEIAPKKDDPLRELLTELGPAPDINLEKESKSGLPAPLTLTKRYQEKEGEKMETRQLWVETKRYIMYILSVQSGKNLLDVLEKAVTTLENERFQQLLLKEQEESIRNDDDRKPTDSDPSLATAISTSKSLLAKSQNLGLEVWSFTFDQLKKTALENMAKLEGVGKVTKANYYQDMLNDIAKNIRDKHRRRQRRKQELVSIRQTLLNLNEKRVYLNEQKKSYNDYISGCMGQLKSKKDKAKRGRVMPFSHQYYHLRELKKSGKVPQFGSYKYTGERLLQKGVLISVADYSAKQLEKVTLTISSDEAGVFHIVATMLGVKLPGGEEEIRLEDLLQLQFDGVQVMDLFDDAAKVNVNLLIFLINKKFYV